MASFFSAEEDNPDNFRISQLRFKACTDLLNSEPGTFKNCHYFLVIFMYTKVIQQMCGVAEDLDFLL